MSIAMQMIAGKCAELAAAQISFRHCTFTGVNPLVDPNIEHCVIRTIEADAAYRAQIERETLERVKAAIVKRERAILRLGLSESLAHCVDSEFAPKPSIFTAHDADMDAIRKGERK